MIRMDKSIDQKRVIILGHLKSRFLLFGMYHNFANLFYKLTESIFYMEMSMFKKRTELKVLD